MIFRLKDNPTDDRCIAIKQSPETRCFGGLSRTSWRDVQNLVFIGQDRVLLRIIEDNKSKHLTMMNLNGQVVEIPITL